MFIPNFFPFISMIEPEGESGGEEQQQIPEFDDLGVPYEEPGEEHQEPKDEVKNNPAWDSVLGYIPEDKRTEVMPKLKEWDDNFAKVQSDYAPYKPLLEHKVSMDEVQRAFAFANLVNTNPKALYDELGQRFGFGQGQQQVANKEDEDVDDPDLQKQEVPDLTKHPEFIRMQQTINQFQEAANNEAIRQQDVQIQQETENQFAALENELKVKLTPTVRAEVINRTVILGDRNGGNYDLREGYKNYAAFVSQVRNSRANNTAPRVLSGNGGLPTPNKPLAEMNDDERTARIVAFLESSGKEP